MATETSKYEIEKKAVEQLREARERIGKELSKVLVGQQEVVEQLLFALFSGGHCLITGAPGLAKTLLVRSIAQMFHLKFNRIQFTPDLMPADITGTEILEEGADGRRRMQFVKGPIFANVLLADEINRTPPKTQAALLEAMQEYQVTAGGQRYPLEEPFFVLATQNPIEMEGTYPLPEAQLDRFMFNVVVDYLPENDEVQVVQRTTSGRPEVIQPLFTGEDVLRFHEVVRKVPIAEDIVRYAVRLAAASRPSQKDAPDFVKEWVSWGAGLRAAQFMVLGAKTRALLSGRAHVSAQDIKALAHATLRHRILINYRAEAEGVNVETVITRLLQAVEEPAEVTSAVNNPAGAPQGARTASFIDPQTLMRIKSLQLRARIVVQGFLSGLHRSPHHGFSVEFSEYRQYTPGDDPRYLDWKLFARSDRYYIKRFEEETNLRCHLLVDLSRSMGFGSLTYTKVDYARTAAATLAYFLSTQRDAVGLVTFDQEIADFVPARYRPGHLHRLMVCLERAVAGTSTDVSAPLEQVAATVRKRGMIVLISDLLAPAEQLHTRLGFLRSQGHEVVILRVLDPAEMSFTFDKPATFVDMETGKDLYIDPSAARDLYQTNFSNHAKEIDQTCRQLGIDLYPVSTARPLELSMFDFIQSRLHLGRQVIRSRNRAAPSSSRS